MSDISCALTFDGKSNYAKIPVSLTDISDWSMEITFSTDGAGSNTPNYKAENCLLGYGAGSNNRNFHLDVYDGYIHIYYENADGDFSLNSTFIHVSDNKKHTLKIVSNPADNGITVCEIDEHGNSQGDYTYYINGYNNRKTVEMPCVYLGYSGFYLPSFLHFTLYSFKLVKNGVLVASYEPTVNDAITKILTDTSGNGNNATFYDKTTDEIDFTLSADVNRAVQTITTVNADTSRMVAAHLDEAFILSADTSRTVQDATTVEADADRKTILPFEVDADTNRTIAAEHLIDFNFSADTGRRVQRAEFITHDTARKVEKTVAVNSDAVRETQAAFEINTDTSRKVKVHVVSRCCTVRNVKFCVVMYLMTSRNVSDKVTVRVPTCVYRAIVINVGGDGSYIKPKKNLVIDANGNETAPTYLDADAHTPQVVGVNDIGRIVSIKIESTTNNMTDTVTIETVNMKFMVDDRLSGTILDYDLSGFKVQSVTQTGYTTTIVATQDWCLFGRAIIYYGTLPTNLPLKKSNSNESGYRPLVTFNKMQEETTYKSPQEKEKLSSALSKLGAKYNGEDYGITTDLNGKSGTIVDMVSSLISWSKAIPTKAINAHIENGVIKCVQRGHEEITTDISTLKHPVETYKEERYSEWSIMSYVDKFESSPSRTGRKKEYEIEGDPWLVLFGSFAGVVEGGLSSIRFSSITRTKSGDPARIKNTMSDGSTETIDYTYYGDKKLQGVYEYHECTSPDNDVTKWGILHQDIGEPESFTIRCNDDGSSESIMTTENFNRGFLGRTRDKVIIHSYEKTWSHDGSVLYHIKRVDNFGNTATYDSYSPDDSYPFPLEKDDCLLLLQEMGRCRKIITLNIDIISPVENGKPQYTHIITHREKVSYNGQEYFLESNTVTITPTAFTQSLTLKRYVQ